jgi:multiple sugar transport system substrate-binding protein
MTAELRGITWDHERGRDPLLATAARFEAETGVRVRWEARSLQGFADQSIPALAETYDLLVFDHPHIGEIVPTGALLPLDEILEPSFVDDQARNSVGPSHASYVWDEHLWGLAIDAAGHVAAYRPDLLDRLGIAPPETWDEVWALADAARASGLSISLPNKAVDTMTSLLTLCANAGVDPYADSRWIVPREVGLEQLARLRRLAAASPAEAFEWSPIQLLDRMAEADEVVYCPILFGYSNYSRPGFRRSVVRFAPIPSAGLGPRGGVIGGAGIGISARCRAVEAARDYVRYVASPETQRTLYVSAGGQPGHRQAWLDADANELASGYFRETLPGLDAGYLRPRYDGALLLQNEGGDRVREHLRAHGDADALLDELDELYRRSLDAREHRS